MRFRSMTPRPIRIAASVLMPLLLSSCIAMTGIEPYPVSWTPIRKSEAGSSCPNIVGVYKDLGEYQPTPSGSGRPCSFESGECRSLIFNLLGDADMAIRIGTNKGQSTTLKQVRIEQPSPGVVEINAPSGERRQTLSIANGDFTCDGNGLRLAEKTAFATILISNVIGTDSRIFNVAEDGSLIMKSEWHNRGHHTFFPFNVTNELWVRWARVDPENSDAKQ